MSRLNIKPRARQAGFTLIEAVIVIVIMGILGGIVAVFIKAPLQSYTDTAARAELSDIADTAVRRISRDVRLALPNSIRLSPDGRTLGFLLTKTGGRYQAAEDGLTSGNVLDFVNGANLSFDMLGAIPSLEQQILPNDFIVVYNLGPGYAPADAYGGGNVATVASVNNRTVTLALNQFALQTPIMASPGSRFQVVTGTVDYFCDLNAGTLTRFLSDRQIVATQSSPPAGVGSLLATNVVACNFNYTALANTRSALVQINLQLRRPGANVDAPLVLFHQVHVDNTP